MWGVLGEAAKLQDPDACGRREKVTLMLTHSSTFRWRNMEAERSCICLEREKGALDTIWTRRPWLDNHS